MPQRLLLHICFFGYFVIGLVITVIGPVIPALQEVFSLSRGQVGAVFVAQGIGYALAVFIGGILSDTLGRLPVLIAGTAVVSVGLLTFGAASAWPVALCLFFVASAGAGISESAINSLAVDLGGEKTGRVLNLLHFFPAAGAVLGPYSADFLLPYGWWVPFLLIGGLLLLFLFLLVFGARRLGRALTQSDTPRTAGAGFQWRLFRDGRLLALAALLALYVGAEASITGWTFSYVIDVMNAPTFVGSAITSLFWLGLMIGRVICARLSQRVEYLTLTAWMGALAAAAYAAALLAPSADWLGVLILAAGVLVGGVFPTVVAHTGNVFPDHIGAATGFIIAACSLGGAAVPAVVGFVAEGYGMRFGLAPVWLALIGVSLFALLSARWRRSPASTMTAP